MIPGELARKLYKLKKQEVAAVKIQKTSRTRLARKDYLRMIFSSVVLQSHLRAKVASVEFKSKRSAAVTIQSGMRAMAACDDFRYKNEAAVVIQTALRAMSARDAFRERAKANAAVITQTDLEEPKEEEATKLEASKEAKANLEEMEVEEATKLEFPVKDKNGQEAEEEVSTKFKSSVKVDEKSVLVETRATAIEIDETCTMTKKLPGIDQDADTIDILTAEVENLKVMLQAEKQRANEFERKYLEARVSSEQGHKKLEET